jgi:3-methyladenine DNA glycosylase AlkD
MSDISLSAKKYVSQLAEIMTSHRSEEKAAPMAKYMKDRYPFYGIKSPERNAILRKFIAENKIPDDWQETIKLCWSEVEREMQYIGMELAYRCRKRFIKSDLELFHFIITEKSWWDTVDFIASNIIGHYFLTFPDQIQPITGKWSASPNMWLNRTCLLFQLKYKGDTDFKLMQDLILQHSHSDEFFIRKAIGWALRQYTKTSPGEVQAFVAETELKPLSKKEALKHIS